MSDPTREAAFDLLSAVLERRRTLEEALGQLPAIEPRDRSAAHRIAAAVLRRMGTLDAVLETYLRREPPVSVRIVLRIGAAGLLLLGTPGHAAVATAVSLTRVRGLMPFTGLVNAVLRKMAAAGSTALEALDGPRLDTPPWLWRAWGEPARAIALAHQHEAPLDVTPRVPMETPAEAIRLPTGTLRLPAGTAVSAVPGFAEGRMWVQDAAAALPAMLLAPQPGELIADLCAAPGGKTGQLAAAGAEVLAVERDPARCERLRDNLRRWGLNAELIQADAATFKPPRPLDAILLDAPCSATGTIRRHPDVPHLKRASDIPTLIQAQDRLLRSAIDRLRPGGRLVYTVCSLQPEEAEPRIEAALRSGLVRAAPFAASELPGLPEALTPRGDVRTHPALWSEYGGLDGFFVARLVRV